MLKASSRRFEGQQMLAGYLSTFYFSALLLYCTSLYFTFAVGSFSDLSISDFELAKSVFLAHSGVSQPVAFFKSDFAE